MTVDAINAKFLDQPGKPVVRKVLTQPPRKRVRVARVDAFAGEAEVEFGAFHAEHLQVERGGVAVPFFGVIFGCRESLCPGRTGNQATRLTTR